MLFLTGVFTGFCIGVIIQSIVEERHNEKMQEKWYLSQKK